MRYVSGDRRTPTAADLSELRGVAALGAPVTPIGEENEGAGILVIDAPAGCS